MAIEKTLSTRIMNKVDTLENWQKSTLGLKKGELAIATVAASAGTGLAEPVCMIKVGEDGVKTFSQLEWNVYAKASDVLSACKSEDALTAFINNVINNAGIATNEALTTLTNRVTTAEGKITTLEGKMTAVEGKASANETAIGNLNTLVGDKAVATQISDAIAALNLAATYEAKGEAAKVQNALDTYKTSNDAAVQKNATDIAGEISRAKAAEEANTNAISAIKDGTTIDSFADVEAALAGKDDSGAAAQALTDAKAYADGLAKNYDAAGAAATAESNAKAYADGLAGNYDAAGSAAQALLDAKSYTDGFTGGKTVSESINTALANYTTTANMNSAIATAKNEAVSHADGLNTAMDARVEVVEGKAHTHTFVESELNLIQSGDVAKWNAAEQNAKDYADDLDDAMDERVQALEAKFGDGEGNVEAQIAAAVAAEATLRESADTSLGNRISTIEGDYLVEADKTALQEQIDVLDGLVGDVSVSKQITDVTNPLAGRVKTIEDDYLKAADKTELQGNINTVSAAVERLTNGVSAEEVDGVNDLIQYVNDHGTEVIGIKADIKANADAIDAIEADYLKASDKTELSGLITGLDTRVGAAETAIGTKAAQADLEALAGRVTTVEGDLNTETTGLKARMTQAEADIDALETKVGDKTVAAQIEAAIEALKIGDYAKAADLTAAITQHNTDKAALEASIATKANDADLAAVAKSGLIDDLSIGEGTVLVFDCGNSSEA